MLEGDNSSPPSLAPRDEKAAEVAYNGNGSKIGVTILSCVSFYGFVGKVTTFG